MLMERRLAAGEGCAAPSDAAGGKDIEHIADMKEIEDEASVLS